MITFDFSGQRVVVTGASRGIGLAVAQAFAAAGAELAILAEDEGIFAARERLVACARAPVAAFRCDVTDREGLRRSIGSLERIDVLVNNAAIQNITPLEEPGPAVERLFARVLDIDVIGAYWVVREALPKMGAGGRIVFTGSVWSKSAESGYSAYVAAKHAVLGLTRTLARELGRSRGIRVNAVCPGWTRTEGALGPLADDARRQGVSERSLLEAVFRAQALDGLIEPEEIAPAFLFLASAEAASITGQTLHVDRGEVMD